VDVWIFYLIGGVAFLASYLVRAKMISTYNKWSRPNSSGLSGANTARSILNANGMADVPVVPVRGKLTDHYDPRSKIVRLSEINFASQTVAAMAVSAHEAGHAIQDEKDYLPLEIRSRIAPLANAAARFGIPAAILGGLFDMPWLVQVGVLAYVGALLFHFFALPVEFNASRQAVDQLENLNLTTASEREGVKSVLRSAALTYVAGAASAAGYILLIAVSGVRTVLGRRSRALPPQ